jgi:hypothetical protein
MIGSNGKRARCTNPRCPGLRWRGRPTEQVNVVELIPAIGRDHNTTREFVGTLYVKEVRVIEGCRCRGVSLSTVAAGEDKKEVESRTLEAAKTRAEMYRHRGYEVTLSKLAA